MKTSPPHHPVRTVAVILAASITALGIALLPQCSWLGDLDFSVPAVFTVASESAHATEVIVQMSPCDPGTFSVLQEFGASNDGELARIMP